MDEAVFPFNSSVENVSRVLVRVVSSAYITNLNFSLYKAKSLTYMMNNNGPRIEPWCTIVDKSSMFDVVSSISTYSFLFVK